MKIDRDGLNGSRWQRIVWRQVLPILFVWLATAGAGLAQPTPQEGADGSGEGVQPTSADEPNDDTATKANQEDPRTPADATPNRTKRPASEFRRPTKPTDAEALEVRPPKPKFLEASPRKPGDVFDLTFDDLAFEIKDDEEFRWSMLTPEIQQYDGAKVRLRGYIRPSFSQRNLKQFVFVRDNQECCFGPGAALYDCVLVKMAEGAETDFTVRPVTIEGEFYLRTYAGPDGNVWAIYRLKDGKVR